MNSLILNIFFFYHLVLNVKSQDDYNEFYDDQNENIGNSKPKPDIKIKPHFINMNLSTEIVDQILFKQITNFEEKRST